MSAADTKLTAAAAGTDTGRRPSMRELLASTALAVVLAFRREQSR